MARVVDLTGENITRKNRKERNYGTKTDLASTVVERGSTHWAEGSNVHIDGLLGVAGTATVSGTLRVTGLLDVTGTFNGSGVNNLDGTNNLSGDNNLTGPTEISGSLDVTGPTTLDGVLTINGDTSITGLLEVTGDTTISGTLDITGNTTIAGDLDVDGPTTITGTLDIQGRTTIKNDLELLAGGIFKAGVTKIEPNGKATFGSFIIDPASGFPLQTPGGDMFLPGGGGIGLTSTGFGQVSIMPSGTVISNVSTVLTLASGVASLLGSLKISSTPTAPASSLTPLGIDASGNVRRIA